MNVLIIGGSGFIGAEIARQFQTKGHMVTVLNRGSRSIEKCVNLVADRNDAAALKDVLQGACFDVCIDTNASDAEQVRRLWSAIDNTIPRALVISSAAVYQETGSSPLDENHPAGGSVVCGDYGSRKSAVESAYRALGEAQHVCFIRPPYVFGEANVADRETWFWTRQLKSKPLLLPGSGLSQVQFVHKSDLAAAVLMLAGRAGEQVEAFNVAGPQTLAFKGLATLLAQVAKAEDCANYVGDAWDVRSRDWFPFHDTVCLTPPGKIMALGWRPAANLAARFRQTFASYSSEELKSAYKPPLAELQLIQTFAEAYERGGTST